MSHLTAELYQNMNVPSNLNVFMSIQSKKYQLGSCVRVVYRYGVVPYRSMSLILGLVVQLFTKHLDLDTSRAKIYAMLSYYALLYSVRLTLMLSFRYSM